MKTIYFLVMAFTVTMAVYIYSPKETFIRHNCLLSSGSCELNQGNINLKISIGPLPLKSEQAISYKVETTGLNPDKVVIHLIGKSMHMEEDYIQLEKNENKAYVATRNFPTCSEKNMIWKAVLLMKQDNHYVRTLFDLQVTTK